MTEEMVVYGLRCTCCEGTTYRYVGKTIRTASMRLRGHRHLARKGSLLPVAKWMRKHGVENIVADPLFHGSTDEELREREIELIKEFSTHVSSGGLNVTKGGDGSLGMTPSLESIEKANRSRAERRGYVGRKPRKRLPRMDSEQRKISILRSRARGEKNGMSRLSLEQVVEIKNRLWDGEKQKLLAVEYGVSIAVISSINTERTWRHVSWPTDRPRIRIDHLSIGRSLFSNSERNIFKTDRNPSILRRQGVTKITE